MRRLLTQTWANLLVGLGTTTLSVVLYTIILPIIIFAFTIYPDIRHRGSGVSVLMIIKASLWSWQTLVVVLVTAGAWIILLMFFFVKTSIRNLNEIDTLQDKLKKQAYSTSSKHDDISYRLSSLISEAAGLQNICAQVRDPYSTPAANRPDLANAIASWTQRAENVLAFDTDPRPLKMWKDAVLWSSPDFPATIAYYLTQLNLKTTVLNRILTRKSLTAADRIGQLGAFISHGNSIKQACQVPSDKLPELEEVQWMQTVMLWLGDNLDEHRAESFNHALHPLSGTMPGAHSPEVVAIWDRTQARIEVLSEIKKELIN